jgi:peptidoglycan/xylan/chitin deacetylase (PgdA/CDA1 family)
MAAALDPPLADAAWHRGTLRIGKGLAMRCAAAIILLLAAGLGGASAAECGPDKLGTSRIAQVGTQGGLLVGLKTYPKAVPLADHEVILTFDDGPDQRTTPQVLRALAEECVRATFFVIGRNVDALPALTRREVEEGHNVAYHTYTHPQPTLRYMSEASARADILKGMIAVERAAYGQDFSAGEPTDLSQLKLHAPFFRFPGFADTPDLRDWFARDNVGIFGTDLWASDWVEMTPDQELKLILGRLEKARRGMLLFHDNRQWTADMLPAFLRELKKRGYRVVHMVPGPGNGPTVDARPGWISETERTIGALKPRLENAAAPRTSPGPIPVKPAPSE